MTPEQIEALAPEVRGYLDEFVPSWQTMDGDAVIASIAEHRAKLFEEADRCLDFLARLDEEEETMMEVTIPGKAMRHLHEIADVRREPEVFDWREVSRRKHGRLGYSVTIAIEPGPARVMADRLRDLADVERDVRAYGSDADSSIERACDIAADRLEAGLGDNDQGVV